MAGCLIWVPIGIWVLALVQWAVQGDIDVLSAFAGILVGVGLGMTALLAKEPFMAPLIFTAVVITLIAFPFVRGALNRRALAQVDVDAIERAYEILGQKPGNAAAKFKLDKLIYSEGMPGHALSIAEDAIQQMPESVFVEEHRILKSWRHYRMQPGQLQPLSCLQCSHPNAPGLIFCEKCGSKFLLDHARGAWVGPVLARKLVAAWVGIIVGLVGIPFAAATLPPAAALVVIVALMGLSIAVLVLAFRNTGATAS